MDSKMMKKRVYFVGFQTNNGGISCNVTLEWINEHTADAYKQLRTNLEREIEEIGNFKHGSVLINSLTILFEEDIIESNSQQNMQ